MAAKLGVGSDRNLGGRGELIASDKDGAAEWEGTVRGNCGESRGHLDEPRTCTREGVAQNTYLPREGAPRAFQQNS